jgi:hypothetical protein
MLLLQHDAVQKTSSQPMTKQLHTLLLQTLQHKHNLASSRFTLHAALCARGLPC